MHRQGILITCVALGASASAFSFQLPAPQPNSLIGARSLTLSPDGKRLAFSYQGDIWVAPSEGGRAVPVTNHIEMDDNPVWSPDSNWIAFSSNRNGSNDIYVVPADGGQSRRLTWHSGSDIPSDWSPDGKMILIKATRDNPANGIYALDVATTGIKQLMLDMMTVNTPRYSVDGSKIYYTRFGFPTSRPRYEGSAAAQLWSLDVATGKRTKIRANSQQHLWPNLGYDSGAMVITVAEKTPSSSFVGKPIARYTENANRTPNVYAVDDSGRATRLTNFSGGAVRYLTVAPKADLAAFEYEGEVFTMLQGAQPRKINLIATIDDKTTQEERLVLTTGASDSALSPKGDKFAFTVRGEIWMVPTKKTVKGPNADDATQLTDWAGQDNQPLWAPDNKTLFFVSDRDGSNRLYKLDSESKAVTVVTRVDADVTGLKLTPDKKSVSFWMTGKEGGLYTVPLEGGQPTRLLKRTGNDSVEYDFSPDGRWVAYVDTLVGSGYYYWESTTNIHILDTKSGQSKNVTRLSAEHTSPKFTPDGRYLVFRSNRSGPGIYALPLKQEDARETELELKFEKPTAPVVVDIDFEGIDRRTRRIVNQAAQGNLRYDAQNGELYFLAEGDIWKAAYNGDEVRRVTSGGGIFGFEFSEDGNQIEFIRSGALNVMDFRRPGSPITAVAFRADWTRDLREERKAAFAEFWRAYNNSFYDANFHARDWLGIRQRYAKLLPSVGHRNEMSTVLNFMIGELEASHTEVSPAPGNPNGQSSAHLGFLVDYGYDGPGIRIKEVPDRTPGSFAKTKLNPGEYVLAINGKDVRLDESLYREVLNEQTGRDVVYLVNSTPSKTGARTVRFRAISSGEFGGIMNNNRLEARRKYVEEKSGGKLTYAHISGMNGGALNRFNQEIWEFTPGKKGLIIDVRNNGGGNTSDQIIDMLERLPNSYYQIRDHEPFMGPGRALNMPMVVMHAETSFSNAEMFPYAMRQRKLATLVGMPTPGYVIYTNGFQIVDGTICRMPHTGVYRLDGSPLENMGQQPDHKIDITPDEYFSGKDPQLDKAIEVLLKQVK